MWYWHNGVFSGIGYGAYFSSVALSSCHMGVAYEYAGNNGKPLYNEMVELEFTIHNNDNNYVGELLSKSPTYYVIYLGEDYEDGNIVLDYRAEEYAHEENCAEKG